MTRTLSIILLLALCGCASPTTTTKTETVSSKLVVPLPPVPNYGASDGMMIPIPELSLPEHFYVPAAQAVAPALKPITLSWDNKNGLWERQRMVTELWATRDLQQPFTLKLIVPPLVNSVQLMPTNTAEFFICRFWLTNQNWFSEFNQ